MAVTCTHSISVGTKMRHGYQNLIPTYIENVGGVTTNMKTAVSNALMLMPENITALNELGKLDALGQRCKFAYAMLQTTKPQLSQCMNRDAAVQFGPVRRPFLPNPEPDPRSGSGLTPNPEPLWGPVWFRSGSGLFPRRTRSEPEPQIFARIGRLYYVIKSNSQSHPAVYRKKRG
ncbi:hypothetical protein V8E53_014520 [Lactarius tabidus]